MRVRKEGDVYYLDIIVYGERGLGVEQGKRITEHFQPYCASAEIANASQPVEGLLKFVDAKDIYSVCGIEVFPMQRVRFKFGQNGLSRDQMDEFVRPLFEILDPEGKRRSETDFPLMLTDSE